MTEDDRDDLLARLDERTQHMQGEIEELKHQLSNYVLLSDHRPIARIVWAVGLAVIGALASGVIGAIAWAARRLPGLEA